VLGHVLLHLQLEVVHEGPVFLVDNAVGDEEADKAHTDQAQTHKQKPLSLTRLDEGESADDDDPNAAEHDAQKIE